mmetsp:Transcript_14272/g.38968  ORF Transcript_14272/g.38968 Transcript_14272/m.38968 type:complete len:329 (-) Transcript_14272:204-1190(-)
MKSKTSRDRATQALETTDSSPLPMRLMPFLRQPSAPMVCLQGMSKAQLARAMSASSCTLESSELRQLLRARSPSFIRISVRHSESKADVASAKQALCRTLSLTSRPGSGRAASISMSLSMPWRRRRSLRFISCSMAKATARAEFSWTSTESEQMPSSMSTCMPCSRCSSSLASTCWRTVERAREALMTTLSSPERMRLSSRSTPPSVLMASRTGESRAWQARQKAALAATSGSSSRLVSSTMGLSPPSSTVLSLHRSSPFLSAWHFSPLRMRRIIRPSATASPAQRASVARQVACTSASSPHHASFVSSLIRTGNPPPSPRAPRRTVI